MGALVSSYYFVTGVFWPEEGIAESAETLRLALKRAGFEDDRHDIKTVLAVRSATEQFVRNGDARTSGELRAAEEWSRAFRAKFDEVSDGALLPPFTVEGRLR